MSNGDKAVEQIVLSELARINQIIAGMVTGLVLGTGIFLATVFLLVKGGDTVGPHLGLLAQFFIGYDVTPLGSIIGFVYGMVSGFIIGYATAWIYNRLVNVRQQGRAAKAQPK